MTTSACAGFFGEIQMSDQIQTVSYRSVGVGAVDRNRVLRNTYGLLAISMVPTVIGAWLGVSSGLHMAFSGILGMVLFMAIAFGFMFAIERTKDSAAGVAVLLAFTFFMGLMMSGLISAILGFRNGPQLIITAFGGTAGVFFAMAALATVIRRDLSGLGQWLFVGVIGLLIAGIINAFVGSTAGMLVISTLAILIFSAFMLFDIKRVIDGGETNYITATLAIYLDILNVFQNLLALLGIFGGERD
jgi:modulator of FtsH protease